MEFFDYLKTLSPSSLDLYIRSLSLENESRQLKLFTRMMLEKLKSRKDFELVQAYFCVFLKLFGQDLIQSDNTNLQLALEEFFKLTKQGWAGLDKSFAHSLCLIEFARF